MIYLTEYIKTHNGYEVVTYAPMSTKAEAELERNRRQSSADTEPHTLYRVELKVGCLAHREPAYFVAREHYAHSELQYKMQVSAEAKMHEVLDLIDAVNKTTCEATKLRFCKQIMTTLTTLKPALTKAQYTSLFAQVESLPFVRKLCYELYN